MGEHGVFSADRGEEVGALATALRRRGEGKTPNAERRTPNIEWERTVRDVDIRIDDLSGPEIRALLDDHLANMRQISPPESTHALPLEGLRKRDVTFWTVWENGELLGCGALKELDALHGEIKSMRTVSRHLRKGVAKAVLDHIIGEAMRRGYLRLSLETGSMKEFEPARQLYARAGFTYCAPFADYIEDPNSVFMTKEL